MSNTKFPRVLAAAKEFNIGMDTLIDFLVQKGFSKDELKATSKLTKPMYEALKSEFSSLNKADVKMKVKEVIVGMQHFPSFPLQGMNIVIDPGTAPSDEIASLLADFSLLYRRMGGSGIEYSFDHVTLKQGEAYEL